MAQELQDWLTTHQGYSSACDLALTERHLRIVLLYRQLPQPLLDTRVSNPWMGMTQQKHHMPSRLRLDLILTPPEF